MKPSKYTISVCHYPTLGEYLLFNSLNQSMVVVNQELKEAMGRLGSDEGVWEGAEEHLGTLEELGILVADGEDESQTASRQFDRLRHDDSAFRAVILTTYGCNFQCSYCIEEGIKADIKMDQETSDTTVNWLIAEMEERQSSALYVDFYGGEPLLNVQAIERISASLQNYAAEHGIAFHATATTNGALLSEGLVDQLVGCGVRGVRVTLDGDREAHNRNRPFKGGRGSFDTIMANLMAVADKIQVRINTNVNWENIDSIPRLLDYLEERDLIGKIDMISFGRITGRVGDTTSAPTKGSDCVPFFEEGLAERMLDLRREAYKRGLTVKAALRPMVCFAKMSSSAVIDPLGRIYKCPALVGYEDFVVGDIHHAEWNHRHAEFLSMGLHDECLDCRWAPLCGGGCPFAAYLKYGDLHQLDCRKRYFQNVGEELLKMEYNMSSIACE